MYATRNQILVSKGDGPLVCAFPALLLSSRQFTFTMASSALDECVSKVDSLILEVGKSMDGKDAPRMTVDPDDPWSDIWTPPPSVYKVSRWEGKNKKAFCDGDRIGG